MKELKIDWDKQIVKHKGITIKLILVKKGINKISPELLKKYRFQPKFNNKNGNITYKYAWDSIFFDFHKSYGLKKLFDTIIKEKNYEQII